MPWNACSRAACTSCTTTTSIGRSADWTNSRGKAARAMESSALDRAAERAPGLISRLRAVRGRFSRGFWLFFAAAFLYDFGFGLFFFLFNLYLTDLQFNEKILGILTGTLTLGNVVGTIPVTMLVRRFGLQRLLLVCFGIAPLICILRTFILWMPA